MHGIHQEEPEDRRTEFRDVAMARCIAGLMHPGYEATVCGDMLCVREPRDLPYLGIDRKCGIEPYPRNGHELLHFRYVLPLGRELILHDPGPG